MCKNSNVQKLFFDVHTSKKEEEGIINQTDSEHKWKTSIRKMTSWTVFIVIVC